jgi:hypothetical protein
MRSTKGDDGGERYTREGVYLFVVVVVIVVDRNASQSNYLDLSSENLQCRSRSSFPCCLSTASWVIQRNFCSKTVVLKGGLEYLALYFPPIVVFRRM